MRILIWHVHGSWTSAFIRGSHEYLLPLVPGRGPDGRGRAATYDWPERAREVPWDRLRDEPVDVVVYQRPHELDLAREWLGRDVPGLYVEHNAPAGDVPRTRHWLAGRSDITLVHVTHFNELYWDNGRARTRVVEHGIPDPGHLYTGELPRAGVVVNEPVRRTRVAGTDLLPRFAERVPLDVFGMKVRELPYGTHEDLPQHVMHAELARRRVYLHPYRWTSLGLALIEAMTLGMPVVALAATEAIEAVPPEAGVLSTKVHVLADALHDFARDPERASQAGKAARAAALSRYGLGRFLADWDVLLSEV
ncbi:glycosyltransferase involved in cell wall biosynthesis [Nonomuraea thailandensis]|uniref:Glycosyltransferase involved in cell wall biosynthesis n=1 Tax=Nonomuraea thailandensis TaxID=1188745 RepID=A0A9X2K0X1_9ACTN|nr:glycosyltransferase [Nonomuraea thailandensis]MCP2355390.1 glycosyltransferase involved in cell wall biosynthesis [Nonomuraea thailandensis]